VQRFEAGEHAQFGARPGERERVFTINGVPVTYGQMIAMADFVHDPGQLERMPAARIRRLVELIERERVRGVGSVREGDWVAAAPDYLDIAAHNSSHFRSRPDVAGDGVSGYAPYTDAPAGPMVVPDPRNPNHKDMWVRYHTLAMRAAFDGDLERGLQYNAFGDHFLTDAFAAGHQVNKADIMRTAGTLLARVSAEFQANVARVVLADPRSAALRDGYEIRTSLVRRIFGGGWRPVNEASLADLLDFIRVHDALTDAAFLNNFAKVVHDQLNHSLGTGRGVEARLCGHVFDLAGDKTLAQSPATLAAGREAVARSRQDILDVRPGRPPHAPPDYQAVCEATWRLVPTLTDAGRSHVDQIVAVYTDPARRETVLAYAEVVLANLPEVTNALVSRGLARRRTNAAPTPASSGAR
jgi:hypothetical protein